MSFCTNRQILHAQTSRPHLDPVPFHAEALEEHALNQVAINGKLAGCCSGAGPDEATLRAEGLGVAL